MQPCPHGGYEAEAVAELETGEVSGESPPFAKAAKDGAPTVLLFKERAGCVGHSPGNSYAAVAVFLGLGTGT